MDRHTRWLRRRLLGFAGRRLLLEGTVVAVVILAGSLVLRASLALAAPWAGLAAQAWVVARLVTTMVANPLGHSYLDHYTSRPASHSPVRYALPTPADDDDDVDPLHAHRAAEAATLPGIGLHPVATLVNDQDTSVQLDVYQATSRLATALVSATTLVATRLSDGRLLLTTPLLVPPAESLIVNFCPGAGSADLVTRHTAGLRRLHKAGLTPIRTGPEVALAALSREQEAFARLGPFLGPLLALGERPKPHLLQAAVNPADLLRLALQAQPASRAANPDRQLDQAVAPTAGSNATGTTISPGSASPRRTASSSA